MAIPIRRGDVGDAPACADIVNDWIDRTDWIPRLHTREAMGEMLRKGIPMREFWVAGAPVAGYLSFDLESVTVMGLYVALPGAGVGKALMDRVKEGRDYLMLWTHEPNRAAHRFYLREGFEFVDRNPEGGDGLPELKMERRR